MLAERIRRTLRREDGFAVMTAMVLSTVMMIMTVGMLATGLHLTNASVRDRNWNAALAVAEAGVDRAVYELTKSGSYAGTAGTPISVPGGEVEIVTEFPAAGYVNVIAQGYVPNKTATNMVTRRIKVAFAPSNVFQYALFSETGLYVKNNAVVNGDVFANEGVELDNDSVVYGDVISATEGVSFDNNAEVREDANGEGGNVYSGGPAGIVMSNNAIVEHGAYAQSTSCSGSPDSGEYGITANGTVQGDAVAWGSISGTVIGTRTPNSCQLASTNESLPQFTWDASLYTGESTYSSILLFETWATLHSASMTGVHYVWVDSCSSDPSGTNSEIDLGGATITDDFTLITNCRVDFNNNVSVTAASDAMVAIIVLNSSADPVALEFKNNFTVTNDAAVLLYTSGLIEFKNNAEENGTVYAGAISIKNNLEVTYDERVERTLGFGDVKYDRQSWIECQTTATGTAC